MTVVEMRSETVSDLMRVLGAACLVFCVSCAFGREVITPADVVALVRDRGAREAVVEIWQSDARRDRVLQGVATGTSPWLKAAKALHVGADAGGAEELNDALASALLRNPYAVLPVLRHLWWGDSLQEVCKFGDDSELPRGVARYVEDLQNALRSPAPRAVAQLRSQCLLGLEKTRQALAVTPAP